MTEKKKRKANKIRKTEANKRKSEKTEAERFPKTFYQIMNSLNTLMVQTSF